MMDDLQLTYAAFDLWLQSGQCDNFAELERVKKILPLILEECCSEKQKRYIMHYFGDQMSMSEIAGMYGVSKSSVCRGIHSGLDRAYCYLKFCSPLFIKAPQSRKYLRRSGGRKNSCSAGQRRPEVV